MVDIRPVFHLSVDGTHNGKVPRATTLTDVPELDSVLIATHGLASPAYSSFEAHGAVGDIVLSLLHLPTKSVRRIVIPNAVNVAGPYFSYGGFSDYMTFSARPIGQGRVLLSYGRTSQAGERSPYMLQVLDASGSALYLGTPQPILPLGEGQFRPLVTTYFEGGSSTDYRQIDLHVNGVGRSLGTSAIGTHRVNPEQFVAIVAVLNGNGFGPYQAQLATRTFTVVGTTVTVDYSPWRVQTTIDFMSGVNYGLVDQLTSFGEVLWVDQPSTATTYLLTSEWRYEHGQRGYTLHWTGTTLTGVEHAPLRTITAAEDGGGIFSGDATYTGLPMVKNGVLEMYSQRWDYGPHPEGHQAPDDWITTARIGQRPTRVNAMERGTNGLPMNFDEWWSSAGPGGSWPQWADAGGVPAALTWIANGNVWSPSSATGTYALGILLGRYSARIPRSRLLQVPGVDLPWIDPVSGLSRDFYFGPVTVLRSGYIIAQHFTFPQPTWYGGGTAVPGTINLSVWAFPVDTLLELGEHRSRGHFS